MAGLRPLRSPPTDHPTISTSWLIRSSNVIGLLLLRSVYVNPILVMAASIEFCSPPQTGFESRAECTAKAFDGGSQAPWRRAYEAWASFCLAHNLSQMRKNSPRTTNAGTHTINRAMFKMRWATGILWNHVLRHSLPIMPHWKRRLTYGMYAAKGLTGSLQPQFVQ